MAKRMTKSMCWILWLSGIVLAILIFLHSDWKIGVLASGLLIVTVDLAIWLIASLLELPCAFTEWVCYPLWPWPILKKGVPMRFGVLIRIGEIVLLVCFSAWLAKVVKSLF